jgi:hypothetical protein
VSSLEVCGEPDAFLVLRNFAASGPCPHMPHAHVRSPGKVAMLEE